MKIESKPKPPAELSKLGYFVGRWNTEGVILPGEWGGGGYFSWTETTKWMAGGFFVVGQWKFKMPAALGGSGTELFVMGYDPGRRVYTFDAFSSQGLHQISTGTLRGGRWLWTSEGVQGGRRVRQRMTMRVLSRKRYTLTFEVSDEGKTWATFMKGLARKT